MIAARQLMMFLALAGCDPVFPPPEQRVTRIDIYADRFEYRTRRYETVTALEIGLKAARDQPRVIELHDCDRRSALVDVLEVVRERGPGEFSVVVPEEC